jgi:ribosomal protein L29
MAKTSAELRAEEERLRKEIFELQFKHSTRQLANPMALKASRHDLARVLTAGRQKSIQGT